MYANQNNIGGMPPMQMQPPQQQMPYAGYGSMGTQPAPATYSTMPGYPPQVGQPVYQQQPMPQQPQQQPHDFSQISTHTNNKDPAMVKSRVFVGNLNTFRLDRSDVIKLFSKFGNILGVNVCKGFAFIQYASPMEADLCVKTMKGYNWEGSELDIKLAFTDPPKPKKIINQTNTNGNSKIDGGNIINNTSKNYSHAAQNIFDVNRKFATNVEINVSDLKTHTDGASDDVLLCGECRYRTYDILNFVDHKRRECQVAPEIPKEPEVIQCFTCEDLFPSSWNLLRHMVTRHNLNLYRLPNDESDTEQRGPRTPSPLPSENDNQNNEQVNGEENAAENGGDVELTDKEIKSEVNQE